MSKAFDRVVIVMLENALRSDVLANQYMSDLRTQGVFLENAYGVTHSSQPNYIAATGGDTFGLYDDTPGYAQWLYFTEPQTPPVTSIVDLLEAKGLTWKSYAEDLTDDLKPLTPLHAPFPTPPADPFPFARKHVPFLSYPNITSSEERLAKIVNARRWTIDLEADRLPNYSWYTPNLVNCGHSLSTTQQRIDPTDSDRSTNVDNMAAFLQSFLGPDPLERFPPRTLVVITFDEAYPYFDPYQIYTVLLGDMLEAGTTRSEPYNHFNLLRSVEENFDLGTLQRSDAVAAPYWFLR